MIDMLNSQGLKILTKMLSFDELNTSISNGKMIFPTTIFTFDLAYNERITQATVGLSGFNLAIDNYYDSSDLSSLTINVNSIQWKGLSINQLIPNNLKGNQVSAVTYIDLNNNISISKNSFIYLTCIITFVTGKTKDSTIFLENYSNLNNTRSTNTALIDYKGFISGFVLDTNQEKEQINGLNLISYINKINNDDSSDNETSYKLENISYFLPSNSINSASIQAGLIGIPTKQGTTKVELSDIQTLNDNGVINYQFNEKVTDFAFLINSISFYNIKERSLCSFFCNFREDKMIKLLNDNKTVYGILDSYYFNSTLLGDTPPAHYASSPKLSIQYLLLGIIYKSSSINSGFLQITSSTTYSTPVIAMVENTTNSVLVVTDHLNNIYYQINSFRDENTFSIQSDNLKDATYSFINEKNKLESSYLNGSNPTIVVYTNKTSGNTDYNNEYYLIIFYEVKEKGSSNASSIHYLSGKIDFDSNDINFYSPSNTSNIISNALAPSISCISSNNALFLAYNTTTQKDTISDEIDYIMYSIKKKLDPNNNNEYISFHENKSGTYSKKGYYPNIYLNYNKNKNHYYIYLSYQKQLTLSTLVFSYINLNDNNDNKSYTFPKEINGTNTKISIVNDMLYIFYSNDDGTIGYIQIYCDINFTNLNYKTYSLSELMISYTEDKTPHYSTIQNEIYYPFPFSFKDYLLLLILDNTNNKKKNTIKGEIYLGTAIFNENDPTPYFK